MDYDSYLFLNFVLEIINTIELVPATSSNQ